MTGRKADLANPPHHSAARITSASRRYRLRQRPPDDAYFDMARVCSLGS